MATEIPHRYTLVATLFIGSQQDMTKGMEALSKKFPSKILPDSEGWRVVDIDHEFIEGIKDTFQEDKIKLTEQFELNFMFYLGWVTARRFINLHLSVSEPIHHINAQPWEWKNPSAKAVKVESRADS